MLKNRKFDQLHTPFYYKYDPSLVNSIMDIHNLIVYGCLWYITSWIASPSLAARCRLSIRKDSAKRRFRSFSCLRRLDSAVPTRNLPDVKKSLNFRLQNEEIQCRTKVFSNFLATSWSSCIQLRCAKCCSNESLRCKALLSIFFLSLFHFARRAILFLQPPHKVLTVKCLMASKDSHHQWMIIPNILGTFWSV